VDETQFEAVASQLASARAAGVVSMYAGEDLPLFTAVLPDSDGVLRARWQTEPTPSDRDWAFLKTLRRGQVVTGTVTTIAGFGVTFVDIGGFTAMINIPELSWRPFNHPSDVVSVGQEVTEPPLHPATSRLPDYVELLVTSRQLREYRAFTPGLTLRSETTALRIPHVHELLQGSTDVTPTTQRKGL
jgi:hypothetical protein